MTASAAVTKGVAVGAGAGVAVRALVFRAGPLVCALALDQVVETMRPLAVRPLAGTPDHIAGLCVMRGVPVPVVDLALLLSGTTAEASRFIAAQTGGTHVALATGQVTGVREITPDPQAGLVAGVAAVMTDGTEPLLVLDGAALLAAAALPGSPT